MNFFHKKNREKGFTLIELMTALSIFIIVITISMGSILGIFNANRKSKSLKTVMNNLNLTLESMSKEMRYGVNYHCGSAGNLTTVQNCPGGDTLLSFLSSDDIQTTYRLNGTSIEKQVASGDFVAVTAPEAVIDGLSFYTLGAGTDNTLQPKIVIMLKGHAGATLKVRSDFILQTLVSQRILDEEEPASYPTPYVYPTPSPIFYGLTVTKAGTGTGTVTGPSINCGSGAGCSTSYAANSAVTLTAAAGSGSAFSGWSGACSGTGSCNLTMNAAKAVTATFGGAPYAIEYLIVAGGGGGAGEGPWGGGNSGGGGGGGGGGVISNSTTVTPGGTVYNITVGSGGAGGASYASGSNGGNTIVSSLGTAIGGGGGGGYDIVGQNNGNGANAFPGANGGSGGGGGYGAESPGAGGAGTAGQGYAGLAGIYGGRAGGGGGAGGAAPYSGLGCSGGIGVYRDWVSVAESPYYYSSGGSCGGNYSTPTSASSDNSAGGGGWFGGGGGGASCDYGSPDQCPTGHFPGGAGGQGRVLIRYFGAQRGTGTGNTYITSYNGYTVHVFNGNGTFTP